MFKVGDRVGVYAGFVTLPTREWYINTLTGTILMRDSDTDYYYVQLKDGREEWFRENELYSLEPNFIEG